MSDVTLILSRIESGDSSAADQLLPLVYEELRRLAAQRMSAEAPDHTLEATALVHEAYLRLVDVERLQSWNSRGHFFAAAAEAMRRILVERARRKDRLRHGGGLERADLPDIAEAGLPSGETILAVHEALSRLEEQEPDIARLVKLHFFAGLTLDEAAAALSISRATAFRDWAYARAFLRLVLRDAAGSPDR